MQAVIDFFLDAFLYLYQKLESVILSMFDMLKDFMLWSFDQYLSLALYLLSFISIPLEWNPAIYINALPPEVINMMGLIGLGDAFKIVVAALLMRMTLPAFIFGR